MKATFRWAALTVLMPLTPGVAQEEGPIDTDRPDFTESTKTVPPGRIQLEGGYTFARSGDSREHALGELLLRVPTGPRSEFRLEIPSYAWTRSPAERTSGFPDMKVGFKVKLAEEGGGRGWGRPGLALLGMTTLPTGASGYRENTLQPEVKLALSRDLSERMSLASNLNYAYRSEGGERFAEFSGSLALGHDLTERTGLFLEYFGFAPGGRSRPNTSYLNGGMTYLVTNDYQLDARAGVGLNGRASDCFLGVGASRRW